MLVLTRKPGESITISDSIIVTVVGVYRDGRVKLGITAPRGLQVDRLEVAQIRNQEAGLPPPRGPLYRGDRPR